MTIQKLAPYGTPASRPSNLVALQSDFEIAQHFISDDRATPCTVTLGSIAQSLGIIEHSDSSAPNPDKQMTRVDIDLLQIDCRTTDSFNTSSNSGFRIVVAGTLAVQQRTPVSTSLLISNSGIWRGRDVLPRAHPNDGFVDVLEIDQELSLRQRALAWRRSATGSHLPHPYLRVSRSNDYQWSGRPSNIVADGVTYKGVVWFHCKVLADAMRVYF